MKELPQRYEPTEAEARWQKHWLEAGTYYWDESESREANFVIDTPPPTVSGLLHMGHIFSYTQADFVARYQRMAGKNVFYPMGFDDNGLPTERLVEKVTKKRAVDYASREEFIAVCEGVAEEARKEFRTLFESVALSVDWRQQYYTISESSRRLSQLSFLDLYRKGHAYRALQPMFWDPVDQTAIAQAEVEDKELDSYFNDILFEITNEDGSPLSEAEWNKPSPSGRGLGEGKSYAPRELVALARNLRTDTTDAEQLLWSILRTRQLGCKFRRQHPVEPYVADFACVERKLIIELDGGQHNRRENQEKDEARTRHLEQHGFRVLRFWNHDVLENIEGVVEAILAATGPHPDPLPGGEGETGRPPITWRGGRSYITIGTTRPELIPACVGIFFHPEDARYAGLEGKTVVTPLFGVKVPVMTDDTVEPEKGSGIMMCCTFGDEADIEKWRKHGLETKIVLNKYGKLNLNLAQNDSAPCQSGNLQEQLQGLKAAAARARMIELLGESGDLLESRPIRHSVKCAERSGAPLEILSTPQWFVRTLDKKEALKARSKECQWHPEWMQMRMEQWIDGLKFDWCISRQRYFGVPFPVWYVDHACGAAGQLEIVIADKSQLPVNPLKNLPKGFMGAISKQEGFFTEDDHVGEPGAKVQTIRAIELGSGKEVWIVPDPDVMDTWATSSISPQLSACGVTPELCEDEGRFARLYPADLRPQAHEIIRTWAFYTLLKSHLHNDRIPWKNLMISGWCLAEDKTKMSKSKGNVVTPVDLILEQGADVVRYWAATSRLGADTAFSRDLLKIGRKLVTKIWNATKFAAIHLEKLDGPLTVTAAEDSAVTEPLDRWILTRLHRAVARATESFEAYEYSTARAAIEDFFWNDFCDNYLELVKARVYGEATSPCGRGRNAEGVPGEGPHPVPLPEGEGVTTQAMSAIHTIHHCLDGILRLFAPILPHVTEELWSHLFDDRYGAKGSIHARGNWPRAADYPVDESAEAQGIAAVAILGEIRECKSASKLSIKWPIDRAVITLSEDAPHLSESMQADLRGAGNIRRLEIAYSSATASGTIRRELEFAAEADAA